MKVVEKFVSINGEGTRAGELAVFLRFKGCNLNCSYCDTKWANERDCAYEELSPEELCAYVESTGVRNVTLTGGEPLLQSEIVRLIHGLLNKSDIRVEIETNGAVSILPVIQALESSIRPAFTMDYKLPSSGEEDRMNLDNMMHLSKADTVKFVAGSRKDLESALEIITKYQLEKRCHVYLSPIFGSIAPKELVDFMIEHRLNDVRLQIQMHKIIWNPDERGV